MLLFFICLTCFADKMSFPLFGFWKWSAFHDGLGDVGENEDSVLIVSLNGYFDESVFLGFF